MMLDLGETESSIAEKTGFSKTTIKHRIKLLELDPEEFRKAEERQPKMTDYFRLEKLSDPDLKKKALASIGTNNFDWTLESCLRRQREKIIRSEWIKYIDSLFVRVEYDNTRKIVKTVDMVRKITDEDKAELDELEENDTLFTLDYCYTEGNTYAYILGGKRDQPVSTYEEEQKKKQARIGRIKEIQSQAKALRRKFVEEYKPKSSNRALMLRALLAEEVELYDVNWNEVAGTLGLPGPKEDDYYTAIDLTEQSDFIMLCVNAPDKVLLTVLADYMEDCNLSVYNWEGKYQCNEGLERWYTVLRNIGYRISDDEQALLDGTHECFKEEEKCQ
jgi:ParB family chromosome partitioning protein